MLVHGGGGGDAAFLSDLWNNENLVFPTFSDSLFAGNHSLILFSSSLTVLNNVFMFVCSIIGTSTLYTIKIIAVLVSALVALHT